MLHLDPFNVILKLNILITGLIFTFSIIPFTIELKSAELISGLLQMVFQVDLDGLLYLFITSPFYQLELREYLRHLPLLIRQ